MNIQNNVTLAPFTSFGLGGPAKHLVEVHSTDELIKVFSDKSLQPVFLLGYGSNTLISDKGLPGTVVLFRGGGIKVEGLNVFADSGVWWDDVVKAALSNQLWGIELMSEIPGSVGAAAYINIAAYGQSIGPLVEAVDVWDPKIGAVKQINRHDLSWGYKTSIFQKPENSELVILRVWLRLYRAAKPVTYQKLNDVSQELHVSLETLENRRFITIEARKRAGSLWKPSDKKAVHTAGSFFRNPTVSEELAEHVSNFDESGKTLAEIRGMNTVHGGNATRVSAAHVMLAAGFKRGQQWGNVKLNDQNLLKIEAKPGATAQEVFNVFKMIQKTVRSKLGITLEPEAQIMGEFAQK